MAISINGTTGISGVDGSASAPALQGVDSNTGVSFGTDTVNINTGGSTKATVDSSGALDVPTDFPIKVNGSEKLRIDSSGNVGIGATSITANTNYNTLQIQGQASTGGGIIRLKSADGSTFKGMIIGDTGGLELRTETIHKIVFSTQDVERMRVTAAGNLQINNLCVAGSGFAQVDNAQSLISQSSTGSSTQTYFIGNAAIQTSSDRRIKKNIVDTEIDASSELKKVRVVDFTWNDPNDKAINNRNSRGKWTGCIAQEIVDVFPFAVNAPRPEGEEIDHDSEALWGMEYGQLVPVLIKGFQELQAKIETLETEKAKMQTDLTALTARVTALEAA
tara:strand:- start:984 stop:1985 length:1002 start_codon:yes stop_codon:yes gene_type:complete